MSLSERVLHRYLVRVAVLSEEKFKTLLIKIRKGADSSVSLKQWIEVLTQLGGWRIEPFVGLVKLHGHSDNSDKPDHEVARDMPAAQHQYESIKRFEVRTLPSNPQPGQRYVMDVTEPTAAGWAPGLVGFTFKSWEGANGLRFTSPEGKIYEHIRGRFDQEPDPMKLRMYRLVPWLRKETKMLEQISNHLGIETYEAEREEAKPKTRSGSGTCPCCFRNIKIKDRGAQPPLIVLHGYRRPGWGQIQGRCYGVNFPPFELSTEGTDHLIKILRDRVDNQSEFLSKLKAGQVKELYEPPRGNYDKDLRKVTSEDPKWPRILSSRIEEVTRDVEKLKQDIALLQDLVAKWKLLPLPEEGQKIKPPPALLR